MSWFTEPQHLQALNLLGFTVKPSANQLNLSLKVTDYQFYEELIFFWYIIIYIAMFVNLPTGISKKNQVEHDYPEMWSDQV